MKRFVGLDGIKGLALIAIVLYHCMQQRLPGGFYGVDVFFTVSGFLIAVSLIRSLAKTGSLNLVRYIPKRAVRLYPALFLLIPVIVSVGWLFDHDILVSIRDQVITVLLGCYNWYAIAGGQSYFDQMNPQVFRHLWFIGVLMQFYVIVPFIVWLMWKLRQTKLSSLIPLGLAAFSSIAMWVMYVPKGDPTRVYFGTDTHSMGLMLGVALAWWVTAPQLGHARQRAVPMPRTISSSASAAAHRAPLPQIPVEHRIWNAAAPVLAFLSLIALVTMAVIGKQDAFAFRGGIILSSLLSVLLIAGTISDDSWMQSLMVFKPLASLGKYSYGIYLWHWPLWILSSALAPKIFKAVGPWPLIMTALLTAIAVMISWRWWRNRRQRTRRYPSWCPFARTRRIMWPGLLPLTLSWCCRWPAACRALLMHLRKPPCRSSWSNRPHNWNVCRKPNTCCCAMPCRHRPSPSMRCPPAIRLPP